MQCILYKIYFWKNFHMYYNLICILYALLCGQNFILVKSGCYSELQHTDAFRVLDQKPRNMTKSVKRRSQKCVGSIRLQLAVSK
jgi:hypothetical protein